MRNEANVKKSDIAIAMSELDENKIDIALSMLCRFSTGHRLTTQAACYNQITNKLEKAIVDFCLNSWFKMRWCRR